MDGNYPGYKLLSITGISVSDSDVGDVAVVLDSNVTISGVELDSLDNYNNAFLLLNSMPGDNSNTFTGSASLIALLHAQSFTLDGLTLGAVVNNINGDLSLPFNANATATADKVVRVLQQLAFSTSDNSPSDNISIQYLFAQDGQAGAASGTVNVTVIDTQGQTGHP